MKINAKLWFYDDELKELNRQAKENSLPLNVWLEGIVRAFLVRGYDKKHRRGGNFDQPKAYGTFWARSMQPRAVKDHFGRVYSSISEAARDLGLHASLVALVAKGKRNHTKGFRFSYV